MKKNIVVIGSSHGIGLELVNHLVKLGHNVYGVSRSRTDNGEWIKGDISTPKGIEEVCNAIAGQRIDILIFSVGVWEEKGFMPDFSFLATKDEETRNIMSINVVAPIEISKRLVKNLSMSNNPRAIYLGAMSGVEHLASDQVAYSASKFALRGAIQGFRKALSDENIGFTVINPGNVATEEVLSDIKNGFFKNQQPIPISDIVSSVDWLMSLSANVEVGDVNLSQKTANKSIQPNVDASAD